MEEHKTDIQAGFEGLHWLMCHIYNYVVYFCGISGTNVEFMFPVQTEDDDDVDDDVDNSLLKLTEEHSAEVAGSINDIDAPTDDEKSCFDFYG